MKLQATKTFTKALNEYNKKNNYNKNIETFIFETMRPNNYELLVDSNYFNHDNDLGLDRDGQWLYKVIKVIYKDDCFANDRYLTTNDLTEMIKDFQTITYDNIMTKILSELEI